MASENIPTLKMRRTQCVAALALISLAACNAPQSDVTDTADAASVETVSEDTELSSEDAMNAETGAVTSERLSDVIDDDGAISTDAGTADAVKADTVAIRQADSHVHGAANLAIALDGSTLSLELESPLYNFLGFEHAPETEAQITTLAMAEATLSQANRVARFNPEALCLADPVEPITLMHARKNEEGDSQDPDGKTDHDHNHEGDHGHKHNEDHSHNDDHAHDHDHAHKDALLSYRFVCQNPDQLQWIEAGLFQPFDNLTEIDLVYLGPTQQMSAVLTAGSERADLVD